MYDILTKQIQGAAYLQWEVMGSGSALEHWRCVEDIVCFIEMKNLLNEDSFMVALRNENGNVGYEELVREIAYLLSFYSSRQTAEDNWYMAERLIQNSEWRQMITQSAEIYAQKKSDPDFCDHIRSERVQEYYKNNKFQRW